MKFVKHTVVKIFPRFPAVPKCEGADIFEACKNPNLDPEGRMCLGNIWDNMDGKSKDKLILILHKNPLV